MSAAFVPRRIWPFHVRFGGMVDQLIERKKSLYMEEKARRGMRRRPAGKPLPPRVPRLLPPASHLFLRFKTV
jgi:hypothetical protein